MIERMTWPAAEQIESRCLCLVPLEIDHAEQMVEVLADRLLYQYTGGLPPTLEQLRRRYVAQAVGYSDDGTQGWLNWVVTLASSHQAIGYVQATIQERDTVLEAEVAWVIASDYQGQGMATEAAATMVQWLQAHCVSRLVAHIHPEHASSAGVALNLGLHPTGVVEDGETRWQA
ncbi:MAG: GNAT family N-acetyltransferase [Nocardioidaceae bacterium]